MSFGILAKHMDCDRTEFDFDWPSEELKESCGTYYCNDKGMHSSGLAWISEERN
jgi:hypothetical protein